MLRPIRRPIAALAATVLLATASACSDEGGSAADSASSDAAVAGSLDGVSFEGEVGEALTPVWETAVEAPAEVSGTTLVAGDGEQVADGDTVNTYLWVGNGTAQEQVFSDYDNGAPQAIPNDPAQIDEIFQALFEGQTYGSRVAVVTTAEQVVGDGENQLGVDPTDTLVIVADLVEKQEVSPTPTSDEPQDVEPETQPSVVEDGGDPVGLDFAGVEEPDLDAPVQRVVLREGDGPAVKADDTVVVDYLGATYDAEGAFDESFSGDPLTSPLSGLIPGWSIGLTGVPVGSRVLLQIPPAFAYGAQGSGEDIPGNATLWFVIDVIEVQ